MLIINLLIKILNKISNLFPKCRFIYNLNYFAKEIKTKLIFRKIEEFNNEFNKPLSVESLDKNIKTNKIVWILWYQGYNSAPDIVKRCIDSIVNNHEVDSTILITEDNIKKYVNLPEYIWNKFYSGTITKTHFSDILRSYLLTVYGGLWVDATIFITSDINYIFNENDFYTLSSDDLSDSKTLSSGRWSGYFIYAQQNNILTSSLYSFFITYWRNENSLIDYFLIDYYIKYLDINCMKVKCFFDKQVKSGNNRFLLKNNLSNKFSIDVYLDLVSKANVHKLSYKEDYQEYIGEDKTFYKKLIDDELINSDQTRAINNVKC